MAKLKDILSEVFEDVQKVDKHQTIEGVRNFGIVGKALYNNNNIMEIAQQLAQVAESAHNHVLSEDSDWFDKVSVSRNMKALKGNVMEFTKTAKEAHAINQRMTSLYEDIGHVLNRYYDISEIREDAGDMDNDGKNEPDDEEYMDNKDKAIKKAISQESLDHNESDDIDKPDKEGDSRVNDLDGTPKNEHYLKRRLKDIKGGIIGTPAIGLSKKNR